MAAQTANTATLINSEVLANSIGGTIVANTVQVTNLTANGSTIEFLLAGQSLPISFGSETIVPAVNLSVYIGANGNATDTLLTSGTIYPTSQNGGFIVTGLVTLRANGKSGGAFGAGGANAVFTGVLQIPSTALGGVQTVQNLYGFASSNGAANVVLATGGGTGNTANLTFIAQPAVGQNCNASFTSAVAWTCNGVGTAVV